MAHDDSDGNGDGDNDNYGGCVYGYDAMVIGFVANGDDVGTKGHVGVTLLSIKTTLSCRNLSKAIRY